jgi:hypothetical protein
VSAPLRLVRRAPRPSVIVDMDRPHFSCPWTMAELERRGPIPQPVISGMYVAAWARAEHCPYNIIAGRLEPHCRYNPSDDLWQATAQTMGYLVGVLGFGVPIRLDQHGRAYGAGAPFYWERN